MALSLWAQSDSGFGGMADVADTPERRAIRARVARDRVRTRFLKREEASILGALRELSDELEAKEERIEELEEVLYIVQQDMAKLDGRLDKVEAKLSSLRPKIASRAAALYRLKRTNLARLIERATAPAHARRLRDWLQIVLAHDASLMGDVREASQADRKLKADLRARQDKLNATRAGITDEVEAARQLRADRQALLKAVRQERKASERLSAELRKAARALDREISTIRGLKPVPKPKPGGFGAQRGRLPWPVAGRVEVTFGKKVDPESGMVMVQKGIDVRAPARAPVRSVFGGTVVYADRFKGFGRMVIVEHPGGYYSLYAHLARIQAQRGRRINQFDVVGLLGASESTKGHYLYFEIRRGKKPVDPLRWLAR
ncbi:MAG: peptidoglycan DD-metalloendopeptidase family protein [Myxococcota bacterium]